MLEVAYILVAIALIVCLVYLTITIQKAGRMIDETEKTIKTLSSDVNVTLHQTNELLVKRTCQNQYLTSTNMRVSWVKKPHQLVQRPLRQVQDCQLFVSQVKFSKNRKGEILWVNYPQSF